MILAELLGDKDSRYIEGEVFLITFFDIFVGLIVVINIIVIVSLWIIKKLKSN